MKKFLSVVLVVVLAASLLTACSSSKEQEYKLGMGVVVNDGSSDGKAQVDATVAVVITDKDGKIVDCVIDVAQNKMSVEGGVAAKGQTYLTKQEKKEDYGMKGVSGIGKEWYEQANFMADFVTGKTANDVKGIELVQDGSHMLATDADILAGCTMSLGDINAAIVKACNDDQAKTFKASATPEISFAAETEDGSSSDASAEAEGTSAMYTTFGACVVVDGKIAAAIVDTIQPKIGFTTEGVVTGMKFGGTKRELKEDYGMKGVSGIGKEWYEQAESFTNGLAGKATGDLAKIETVTNESGHVVATDADILAGCTMAIDGYISVLTKAINN